jgi:hypothetical protein
MDAVATGIPDHIYLGIIKASDKKGQIKTADLGALGTADTKWTTGGTGQKLFALTAPWTPTVQDGYYFCLLWTGGAWTGSPKFLGKSSGGVVPLVYSAYKGDGGTGARSAMQLAAQTTIGIGSVINFVDLATPTPTIWIGAS